MIAAHVRILVIWTSIAVLVAGIVEGVAIHVLGLSGWIAWACVWPFYWPLGRWYDRLFGKPSDVLEELRHRYPARRT